MTGSSNIAATIFAYFLFVIVAYNVTKLPWYLGLVKIPSYGLESSISVHAICPQYRSSKLQSHPVLFLVPHLLLGCANLTLFGMYLLGWGNVDTVVMAYFICITVHAIHILPERSGIPNRTRPNKPINEASIVVALLGVVLYYFQWTSTLTAMIISFLPSLGAPLLEAKGALAYVFTSFRTGDWSCESPETDDIDPNIPIAKNMAGYYGLCPCADSIDPTRSVRRSSTYTPIE